MRNPSKRFGSNLPLIVFARADFAEFQDLTGMFECGLVELVPDSLACLTQVFVNISLRSLPEVGLNPLQSRTQLTSLSFEPLVDFFPLANEQLLRSDPSVSQLGLSNGFAVLRSRMFGGKRQESLPTQIAFSLVARVHAIKIICLVLDAHVAQLLSPGSRCGHVAIWHLRANQNPGGSLVGDSPSIDAAPSIVYIDSGRPHWYRTLNL